MAVSLSTAAWRLIVDAAMRKASAKAFVEKHPDRISGMTGRASRLSKALEKALDELKASKETTMDALLVMQSHFSLHGGSAYHAEVVSQFAYTCTALRENQFSRNGEGGIAMMLTAFLQRKLRVSFQTQDLIRELKKSGFITPHADLRDMKDYEPLKRQGYFQRLAFWRKAYMPRVMWGWASRTLAEPACFKLLNAAKLLTRAIPLGVYLNVFSKNDIYRYRALKKAGYLTTELSADWCAENIFHGDLRKALVHSGIAASGRVHPDWYAKHLSEYDCVDLMVMGLISNDEVDVAWCLKVSPKHSPGRVTLLLHAGLLTRALSVQWYVDHIYKGGLLLQALHESGHLETLTREQIASFFGDYESVLFYALDLADLLYEHDVPPQWYADHFSDETLLYRALLDAYYVGPDITAEFLAEHIKTPEYLFALLDIGDVVPKDLDWLTTRLSGAPLLQALHRIDVLTTCTKEFMDQLFPDKDELLNIIGDMFDTDVPYILDKDWYARHHFLTDTEDMNLRVQEEERLLRALTASGLLTPGLVPWAQAHFNTHVIEGVIDCIV